MDNIKDQTNNNCASQEDWEHLDHQSGSLPALTTGRLLLRALHPSDAPCLLKYYRAPEQTPYVDLQPYTELQQIEAYIEKMNAGIADAKWLIWAITLPSTNILIGTISIWQFDLVNKGAELGYGLLFEHRHQGYMTEALKVVEDYAFNKLDLAHLDAYTHELNRPSNEFLLANNYQPHGTCTDVHSQTGEPMNMVIYRKTPSPSCP